MSIRDLGQTNSLIRPDLLGQLDINTMPLEQLEQELEALGDRFEFGGPSALPGAFAPSEMQDPTVQMLQEGLGAAEGNEQVKKLLEELIGTLLGTLMAQTGTLDQAEQLAGQLEEMGHPDMADSIREAVQRIDPERAGPMEPMAPAGPSGPTGPAQGPGPITPQPSGDFEAGRVYPPNSPEAVELFREAARLAGVPESWAQSPGLHNILQRESGGQVGRPNYTYGDRANDPSQWGDIHAELRAGQKTARSSATGLGQLLLDNVDRHYPSGRAGIGNPVEEAAGMLSYIQERYGNPENAWAQYGVHHEGY